MGTFMVWRDVEDERDMQPLTCKGRLAVFPTHDAAKCERGSLGVVAYVTWARVVELCRVHELRLPVNGKDATAGLSESEVL